MLNEACALLSEEVEGGREWGGGLGWGGGTCLSENTLLDWLKWPLCVLSR